MKLHMTQRNRQTALQSCSYEFFFVVGVQIVGTGLKYISSIVCLIEWLAVTLPRSNLSLA